MPLYDFSCAKCDASFEAIVKSDQHEAPCKACGEVASRMPPAAKLFSIIVPAYPGCKKRKAGYLHTHGNRPRTPGKIQVGYGS